MHEGYYQGILQLRNVDQTIIDFTLAQFAKNNVSVAKVKPLRTGVDVYSASNRFSRSIARKLQHQWGGEIKESPRIFTRDRFTCKDVYRLNVYYSPLPVRAGDVIVRDDKVYKITTIEKNILVLLNLATGKKTRARYEKDVALPTYETLLVSVKPHLQVLDEDYQVVNVVNSRAQKENDPVTVVFYNHEAYLV